MNAIDIKMRELRRKYYLNDDEGEYYCPDEYVQDGNIRLLFGMLGCAFFGKYVDDGNSPFYYYDNDYIKYSKENFEQIVDDINQEDDYGNKITSIILNRFVNGNKKNNFGLIRLDAFGVKKFDEEQRAYLIEAINIFQPDALIIGFEVSTSSNKMFDINKLKCVFGNDVDFYPLPLPPNMNESHLALIKGIENLNTDVYVLSWDKYDIIGGYDNNNISQLLKYLSDTIVKNKRNNN